VWHFLFRWHSWPQCDIQAVVISGWRGKRLAFVGDLLAYGTIIPLPWIMAYDLYPGRTLETKRKWVRVAKRKIGW